VTVRFDLTLTDLLEAVHRFREMLRVGLLHHLAMQHDFYDDLIPYVISVIVFNSLLRKHAPSPSNDFLCAIK
jgi:hypothetical protein